MSVVNGAVWLAVLLIVLVRQPKAGSGADLLVAGEPDLRLQLRAELFVWSVARPLEILSIAAYVHLRRPNRSAPAVDRPRVASCCVCLLSCG